MVGTTPTAFLRISRVSRLSNGVKMFPFLWMALGFPVTYAQSQEWWHPDWPCRKQITLKNIGPEPIKAGTFYRLDVPSSDLARHARADLADVRLVSHQKEIPVMLQKIAASQKESNPERIRLWFRLPYDLSVRSSDSEYFIYFGNAPATSTRKPGVDRLGFYEDFNHESDWRSRIQTDPKMTVQQAGGVLVVTDADSTRRSYMILKNIPAYKHFHFSLDYTVKKSDAPDVLFQTQFLIEFDQTAESEEKTRERINALLSELSAPVLKKREAATDALIQLGRIVEEPVRRALQTRNPEVKWRLEHILERLKDTTPQHKVQIEWVHLKKTTALIITSGTKTTRLLLPDEETSASMHVDVSRDPEGYVEVMLNDQSLFREAGLGDVAVKSISLGLTKTSGLSQIEFDNVMFSEYEEAESSIHPEIGADIERIKNK